MAGRPDAPRRRPPPRRSRPRPGFGRHEEQTLRVRDAQVDCTCSVAFPCWLTERRWRKLMGGTTTGTCTMPFAEATCGPGATSTCTWTWAPNRQRGRGRGAQADAAPTANPAAVGGKLGDQDGRLGKTSRDVARANAVGLSRPRPLDLAHVREHARHRHRAFCGLDSQLGFAGHPDDRRRIRQGSGDRGGEPRPWRSPSGRGPARARLRVPRARSFGAARSRIPQLLVGGLQRGAGGAGDGLLDRLRPAMSSASTWTRFLPFSAGRTPGTCRRL